MGLVYFSFHDDDTEFIKKIIKHAKDPDYESLNFSVAPLIKKWDTDSISVMQNFILKSLKYCNRTIVFVGESTYASKWVPVEVDLSFELKKPVYAMRVQGTKGQIPECLIEHGIKVEDWNIEVLQYLATR